MNGKNRDLPDEDRALWDTFTKPIKPLRKKPVAKRDEASLAPTPPRKSAAPRVKAVPAALRPIKIAPPPAPPLAPLSRREKAKVARGRVEIEGRLDLHGHTQVEAHAALIRFLHRKSGDGARIVLIITGKSGVLRQQVPHWLNLPEVRTLVIGFESASPNHGGDGALYVRVRRAR